jgi:hypothetical protein
MAIGVKGHLDRRMPHEGLYLLPMKRCTMWWGTAIDGNKNYEGFYEPRARLRVRKEEPRISGCFMNIDPPRGARRKIVKAVRTANACLAYSIKPAGSRRRVFFGGGATK